MFSVIVPVSIHMLLGCLYVGWVERPCIMNCTVTASPVVSLGYSASFMRVKMDLRFCYVIIK